MLIRHLRFVPFAAALFIPLCNAQNPTPPDAHAELPRRSDIVVSTTVVIAPTTIVDKSGNYINGLTINDFSLYDNNRKQRITADVAQQPLSMVVAVQGTAGLDAVLPKVQRLGTMLSDLVAGQDGEVAVVEFDHRVRTLQPFTTDGGKLDAAMHKITEGSSTAAQIDAVTSAVRMLRSRPDNRRRVLLLISEKRDKGSEGRLREALEAAQFANVAIYSVDISHLLAKLTSKEPPPPQYTPIPATAQHIPAGGVVAPGSADVTWNGSNFIPLFVEIFKSAKSIFVDDTLDVFTRYTGGKEYSFATQNGLEKSITAIGEELHSQYLLSYTPNNQEEGGFHEIRVEVDRPKLEVRTRPGYWVAARQ